MVPICTPSIREFGLVCANAPKIDPLPTTVAAGSPASAIFPNSRLVNISVSLTAAILTKSRPILNRSVVPSCSAKRNSYLRNVIVKRSALVPSEALSDD